MTSVETAAVSGSRDDKELQQTAVRPPSLGATCECRDQESQTVVQQTNSVLTMTSMTSDQIDGLDDKLAKVMDLNQTLTADKSELSQRLQAVTAERDEGSRREEGLVESLRELREEVEHLQHKVESLQEAQSQAAKSSGEAAAEAEKRLAELSSDVDSSRSRARMAQAQTLGARHQLVSLKMDWAIREGVRTLSGLNSINMEMKARGQVPGKELNKKATEWHNFLEECQRKKMDIGTNYKSQLEELEAGRSLEELEPVAVNPPAFPSPPTSNLKSPASPTDGQAGSDDSEEESECESLSSSVSGCSTDVQQGAGLAASCLTSPPGFTRDRQTGAVDKTASTVVLKQAAASPPGLRAPRPVQAGAPASLPNSPGLSKLLAAAASSAASPAVPLRMPPAASVSGPPLRSLTPGLRLAHRGAAPRLQPPPGLSLPTRQPPTFDRLVSSVQQTYPTATRQEILKVIEELRKSSEGGRQSLAGVEFPELVSRVMGKLGLLDKSTVVSSDSAVVQQATPADSCTICTDDIEPRHKAKQLDCGHTFHEECIKKWLHQQSTCPNCRVHSLLPEEFPTLR